MVVDAGRRFEMALSMELRLPTSTRQAGSLASAAGQPGVARMTKIATGVRLLDHAVVIS